jgi:uncharacterized protein (DUF2147 family)
MSSAAVATTSRSSNPPAGYHGCNPLDPISQKNLDDLYRQVRANPFKPTTVINLHPWELQLQQDRFIRGLRVPACEPGMMYAYLNIRNCVHGGGRYSTDDQVALTRVFTAIKPIDQLSSPVAAAFLHSNSNKNSNNLKDRRGLVAYSVGIARRDGTVAARLVSLFLSIGLFAIVAVVRGEVGNAQRSDSATPLGRWRTVDDLTGKINSVVTIWEEDGKLYGRIERLINPDPNDPDPRCLRCSGDLKGQRLFGLRILWGLSKDGDQWTGGEILDPDNGKTYRCSLTVKDGGKKLRVRGFIGFSLLGRTQYWLRDE